MTENNNRMYVDPFDPLFLHPSDHPGMLLVSKPFDGTNYGAWKKSMTIALSAKNKLGLVNGRVPKPTANDNTLSLWQRCNDMVTSWILNALSPEIGQSVLYSEDAHQIWKELDDRYSQANGAKLYQLQKDLASIEQNDNDIASYYTRFKSTWDELTFLRSFPVCTCGSVQAIQKHQEDERLVQFLMELNSDYNAARGNILMMKPLPSLNEAYSILVQEEKQKEIRVSGRFNTEASALYTVRSLCLVLLLNHKLKSEGIMRIGEALFVPTAIRLAITRASVIE